jgi:hypothetical protein
MAAKSNDERIEEPNLSDIPYDELVDVVRCELEQVVKNILPNNWTQDDAQLLGEAFNDVLKETSTD